MKREDVIELLKSHLKNKNLIKHCLAVGAIMKKIAEKMGRDPQKWEIVGILHDIDYEKTKDDFSKHGILAEQILEGYLDKGSLHAIKAHNYENTGVQPITKMDYALIASDSISGLIVATALVMPSRKLEEVKVKSVLKKFKQKDFARNVNRENILFCEKLGFSLEEFANLSLEALKEISEELGL